MDFKPVLKELEQYREPFNHKKEIHDICEKTLKEVTERITSGKETMMHMLATAREIFNHPWEFKQITEAQVGFIKSVEWLMATKLGLKNTTRTGNVPEFFKKYDLKSFV